MIDRYTIHASRQNLMDRFSIEDPEAFKQRYNAAPSQLLPVITHENPQGFSYFYWGSAPEWSKNKTFAERIINTRAEQIIEKPVMLKNLKSHRCLVPANGFYLWKRVGKKTNIPWYVRLKTSELVSFPGLWEEFDDAEGNIFHTFTIITKKSEKWLTDITDRVPVIFKKNQEVAWLNQKSSEQELIDLFVMDYTDQLEGYNVSPQINALTHDSPGLILPTPPADQFGNLTLFG